MFTQPLSKPSNIHGHSASPFHKTQSQNNPLYLTQQQQIYQQTE